MGLTLTLVIAAAAAMLAALFGWLGARKPDPGRAPRLVPWRMLMVLAATAVLLMIVHAANLLGFKTGR
jgi:hypothetical protein